MRPRTMVPLTAVLPLLALGAACDDSPPSAPVDEAFTFQVGHTLLGEEADVTLRAEADAFEPGGPLTLILENRSGQQVGFNLCFHALERREGDTWTLLEVLRICTAHLNLLDPGATSEYETALPDGLRPGEYRVRVALYLLDNDAPRDQVSAPFVVGG